MTDYHMPAETCTHSRTWMAFPSAGYVLGDTAESAESAMSTWTAVAQAVARHEPVTMLVDPSMAEEARRRLGAGIDIRLCPLDDAWMRDSGPTFVKDGDGRLAAVDWRFNGWGAQRWASWGKDAEVGRTVASLAGVPCESVSLTLEGGGFQVDGNGTAILTETVALDPRRNPGKDKAYIESVLHRLLGIEKTIWLPRGLTRDYGPFGTRGHVDIVAAMPSDGVVLVHDQRDPRHPDHEVSRRTMELLSHVRDARGRQFTVVPVPAPAQGYDDRGEPVDWSYINHYAVNGAVIACAFHDPHDEEALSILGQAYPGRTVEPVMAVPLFERGGGIHCITQQQPADEEE